MTDGKMMTAHAPDEGVTSSLAIFCEKRRGGAWRPFPLKTLAPIEILNGHVCLSVTAVMQELLSIDFSAPFSVSGLHAEIVEVEIEVVSPSIFPLGNFDELNRTVTCMVLNANDRRSSCPCHDEFRGLRSDYVRQVALENNNRNKAD
ncbi:hypothetical protein TNCV_4125341 [Trichonephila clavipes]|nr:hypothetical protein TNCV_4125341 [Trichonephila clavipes]